MTNCLELDEKARRQLRVLFKASGIENRHAILSDFDPSDESFQLFPRHAEIAPFPSTRKRMELYQKEAPLLAQKAIWDCISVSPVPLSEVTHLITISCTGMYAPGLDIDLIEMLELSNDVERTAINFMGCYAAFNGLKTAYHIAKNEPDSNVLVVAVELCSLHFQNSADQNALLSNTLFGDGSAAAMITSSQVAGKSLSMESFHNSLALEGKDEMGWFIRDLGFEMKLTPEVPKVIQRGIGALTKQLLEKLDISLPSIDHFAIHPGGRKILDVIEKELGIVEEDNWASRNILGRYGNMSSPTVLFVLKELWSKLDASHNGQNILSFAFGPGLTLESMLYKIQIND